jgi:hypothetical protein
MLQKMIICLHFFVISGGAMAGVTPPPGKRIYFIETGASPKPTKIRPETVPASGIPFMRDPLAPDGRRFNYKVAHRKAPAAQPIPAKRAVVNLKGLRVTGNPSQPRVKFDSREAELSRADEPVSNDFLQKIYDDADKDF